MSENKKNPFAAIVFVMFVVVLPIVTVIFSKTGLDKYKGIRSEMRFLNDSIRVDFNTLGTHWDAKLDNEFIRGKLVVAGFWDAACRQEIGEFVDSLKSLQNNFSKEDQKKLLFVIHTDDFKEDSTWALINHVREWQIDTAHWRFTEGSTRTRYKMEGQNNCSTIAILDGRVSRKDDSGNYKNGPLLCDYYDLKNRAVVEQLLRHMAVIMPAKQRKKIEYKADEKLY